jgi:hypothetical protein
MQLNYNQTNHEIIPILKNIKYLWINIQNNISIDIDKIITIQRLFRKNVKNKRTAFNITLLNILNKKENIPTLKKCYLHIYKIMTLFPPKKNENKFIYGKLIEKIIIRTINNIISCYELDNEYNSGSCYKNDCRILSSNYSIKVMKSKTRVIIINKHHKLNHDISNMSFIICNISKKDYIYLHILINIESM